MTEPTKSARDVIADVPDVWSNHSDYPMELGLGIHTADRIMDALAKAGYQVAKAAEGEAADPRTTLHTVISDIREASGLGGRPAAGAVGEDDVGLTHTSDARWAVNYLLEQIAAKFEASETWDVWKSDAAALVRSYKHALLPASPSGDKT